MNNNMDLKLSLQENHTLSTILSVSKNSYSLETENC